MTLKVSTARPIPGDRPLPDGLGGSIVEPEVKEHPWVNVQKAQLELAIQVRHIQLAYDLTDEEVVFMLAQEISSQVCWWQFLPERGRK